MVIGIGGCLSLLGVYALVLLRVQEVLPPRVQMLLRDVFFNAEGIIAATAFLICILIPFVLCLFVGKNLFKGTHAVRFSLLLVLLVTWVVAFFLTGIGAVLQTERLVNRVESFSSFGHKFKQNDEILESTRAAFRTALQEAVDQNLGKPIEGYEPSMFLSAFRGLSESDFEGVEASIGHYTMEEGRLIHKMDNARLIHSAAKSVTNQGMDTLLENISQRLSIDLSNGGTLTQIMNALSQTESVPEAPAATACTLEAKLCPDGSAVGRQGPSCEFAPCP